MVVRGVTTVPPAFAPARIFMSASGTSSLGIIRAAEHQADLIVLTSPPFHPEQPLAGLGSMTWRISLLASCPVLLVKNK